MTIINLIHHTSYFILQHVRLKKIVLALTLLLLTSASAVYAQSVPNAITFQSALFDSSGNPITDDTTDLLFRIVDDQNNELYAEEQRGVQVYDGLVNVIIGSGIEPNSNPAVPTGGLPVAALDPNQVMFLEVTVGGTTTLELLELTSVPYAYYAEQALNVAPGSITSESIAAGAITFSDITGTITLAQLPTTVATDAEVTTAVNSLQTQITTNTNNISSNTTAITTNGTNITGLQGTVADHETRIGALENSQSVMCAISVHTSVLNDTNSDNCMLYGVLVDLGANNTAVAGVASISNIQDDGVFEKKDQINVLAAKHKTLNSAMLFLLSTSRDVNAALGGLAIGIGTGPCPNDTEKRSVSMSLISNKGALADGSCQILPGDIQAASNALDLNDAI